MKDLIEYKLYKEQIKIDQLPGLFWLWLTNPRSVQGVVHHGLADVPGVRIHQHKGNADPLQAPMIFRPSFVYFGQKLLLPLLGKSNADYCTHQASKYEDELDYICVRYRIEATQQRVGNGDSSRDPDAHSEGQVQNHAHGPSYSSQENRRTHNKNQSAAAGVMLQFLASKYFHVCLRLLLT